MGNSKHRLKKKKRHERQIAEGIREPTEKKKREKVLYGHGVFQHRKVRLSELDPVMVRQVLKLVEGLRI